MLNHDLKSEKEAFPIFLFRRTFQANHFLACWRGKKSKHVMSAL